MQYKIVNLMQNVLKSKYKNRKKWVLMLKQTNIFIQVNVNALMNLYENNNQITTYQYFKFSRAVKKL